MIKGDSVRMMVVITIIRLMYLYYVCANNGKLTISKCVASHLILATHIYYYPIFTLSPTKTQRGALPFSVQRLVFNLNFLSPPVFLLPLVSQTVKNFSKPPWFYFKRTRNHSTQTKALKLCLPQFPYKNPKTPRCIIPGLLLELLREEI